MSKRAKAAAPAPAAPRETTRAGRVAIVGMPNVGKSTLFNALVGEPIAITSAHPQTTREPVRGVLTTDRAQFVFVDTPGLHSARTRLGHWMNEVARSEVLEADAVVLVTAVPRAISDRPSPDPDDLRIASELPDTSVVLVINKVDRLQNKASLLPLIAGFSAARSFAATVPMSARAEGRAEGPVGGRTEEGSRERRVNDGIEALCRELSALVPEQPPLYEPGTLSDQPERFFVAELVREQILRHTRQEVPHGVAVFIERFDQNVSLVRIEATIHVARDAHTGILVGAQGRMLKSIGTAARARIERVLGRRVHLELRVRATPDWMNDEARLRELGYGRRIG
jgi:GTPase